ncbi:serum paraoxonase/arylesterase 2 [Chanos chanos]|uniref:Paraoxonase n=1 Tax=Chanos chanos TaxID=29144 RepID=A0A6J2W2J4_CHACN|nr:serum paraoxonase/arylesterase 2-like [Chanos chanos]
MGKVLVITVVVAAVAIFVGERAVNFRKRALASREINLNHLPNCQLIKGIEYGAEDITRLPDGRAIMSTGLKLEGVPVFSQDPGKMYILDPEDTRLKPVELRIGRGFDVDSFNPHGISVYADENDGSVYVFVVNHPNLKSQLEIFKFMEDEDALVYLKTIKHELLHSLNDIVAVGPESFYATNDQYFTYSFLKTLAVLFTIPLSNVVYYSPKEVKIVADGFYFTNGINISPDKRHIYVADIIGHNVHVLERKSNNNLVPLKVVEVGTLPDNIEVEPETGDLWLGCFPNGWKAFVNDPEDPAGSEVIRIQNIHSDKPVVTQVYADDGKVLIGSTVATRFGGKLLIGTNYHRALCCDLP